MCILRHFYYSNPIWFEHPKTNSNLNKAICCLTMKVEPSWIIVFSAGPWVKWNYSSILLLGQDPSTTSLDLCQKAKGNRRVRGTYARWCERGSPWGLPLLDLLSKHKISKSWFFELLRKYRLIDLICNLKHKRAKSRVEDGRFEISIMASCVDVLTPPKPVR